MNLRKSLRDQLFRYRKRKKLSLDGSVAGLDSFLHPGTSHGVSFQPGMTSPAPQDYLGRLPEAYNPHPGFADFDSPEYESYQPESLHLTTPRLRQPGSPHIVERSHEVDYDSLQMTDELFTQAMQDAEQRLEPAMPSPIDHEIRDLDVFSGQDAAAVHLESISLEIEEAFDQQMKLASGQLAAQEALFNQLARDPFVAQERAYERVLDMLGKLVFGETGPVPLDHDVWDHDLPTGPTIVDDSIPEAAGSEFNYDDSLVNQEAFDQAMQAMPEEESEPMEYEGPVQEALGGLEAVVAGEMYMGEPQIADEQMDPAIEPMPDPYAILGQPQYDPTQQQPYEDPMQQLMNPFGMPGMGPMGPMM